MWYLDSGCSRHMTKNKALFISLKDYSGGSVRFGDEGKAKVIGKGTVSILGMSKLRNVYLVDGLKTNLLNIGQLCNNSLLMSASSLIKKKEKLCFMVKGTLPTIMWCP